MTSTQTAGGGPLASEIDHGILTLTLNRPERLNAIDDETSVALASAFRSAAGDDAVAAVILTGAGRAFSAGADLKATRTPTSQLLGIRSRANPLLLTIAGLAKPVIAAVNGIAAGFSLGIMGAADYRVSAATASFHPATVALGVVPDGGMTYFVPRLIGPGRAFLFLCGGESIDAGQAEQWGLVDEIVPAADLLDRAREIAARLISAPGATFALTKRLLQESGQHSLPEQLELEHRYQDLAFADPGQRAAWDAVVGRLGAGGRG